MGECISWKARRCLGVNPDFDPRFCSRAPGFAESEFGVIPILPKDYSSVKHVFFLNSILHEPIDFLPRLRGQVRLL
jgi:hypothetical protein